MGTRHLTAVFLDGEYKIAQYGQWDGYPEGQGIDTLTFLRNEMNMETFKAALRNSSYISDEELAALWKVYAPDSVDGMVTLQQADAMKHDHPEFSRDTGAGILKIVQSHPDGIQLHNQLDFAADSLFCEWAWVIDLDAGTFEAYEGFNHEPLTPDDRFYFLRDKERKNEDKDITGDSYYGVRLVAKWDLTSLPTDEDFLAAFKTEENEDE